MTPITSNTARSPHRQSPGWQDTAGDAEAFVPLTAEQARQWRNQHPQLRVARVLAVQALIGAGVALLAWALTGEARVAWSAVYGALVGVLPTALAARRAARWAAPGFPPGAALAGLLMWEAVKVILAVGMLMAAPKILGVPSWPALLVSLVLTIKAYWIGLLLIQSKRSRNGQARKVTTNGC
ncbi:MAG TPA: ATP synthase subunit I [Ottowia sp.]|uniref:ATP synthase subunit I n=1 Tax=Ottowia sp. TaxID=1898956 RepID=UPI002C62D5C6|nr:ATP synthase subunit I [Ottowia sp.]HMN22727.1 ATP synthase subunit I [Ottowia sp.]